VGTPGKDDGEVAKYLKYSHVGLQFLLSVGIPTGLGIWLDRVLGTVVLFTLLGLGLGFTAGIYSLYGELYGRLGGGPKDSRKNGNGS